jgi:hypothetical protein
VVNILVSGVDVVLQQDGDAMQRPSRPTSAQLVVQGVGDRHRFGIELDDAEEARTAAVERFDPLDVHLGQLPDRQLASPEVRSKVGNRGAVQLGKRSGSGDRSGV